MPFGPHKLLVSFLEKDNVKLLVYEVSGRDTKRIFAGQISMGADVLKDAFIADPVRFSNQIKIAFNQKPPLAQTDEVVLFMPLEKTFTKAIPASDSVDSFVRSLPYFKEELLLQDQMPNKKPDLAALVTQVAFERKLVEDFQRPFHEAGKKIVAVRSAVNVLTQNLLQTGKFFVFVPFDREISVVLMDSGQVIDSVVLPKDVFVGRLGEFIVTKNYSEVHKALVLAVLDPETVEKLKTERNLEVEEVDKTDVYDLVMQSFAKEKRGSSFSIPKLPTIGLPSQKYLFLGGAVLIGFALVYVLARSFWSGGGSKPPETKKTVSEEVKQAPLPEPKPGDYSIRVLNGTSVPGEAGKLAEVFKSQGFVVTETKNATNSAFVTTKLRLATDVPEKIVAQLESDLSTTYETVVREPLDDLSVKIEVIIGKKK
jgi:hypothetical protein